MVAVRILVSNPPGLAHGGVRIEARAIRGVLVAVASLLTILVVLARGEQYSLMETTNDGYFGRLLLLLAILARRVLRNLAFSLRRLDCGGGVGLTMLGCFQIVLCRFLHAGGRLGRPPDLHLHVGARLVVHSTSLILIARRGSLLEEHRLNRRHAYIVDFRLPWPRLVSRNDAGSLSVME